MGMMARIRLLPSESPFSVEDGAKLPEPFEPLERQTCWVSITGDPVTRSGFW